MLEDEVGRDLGRYGGESRIFASTQGSDDAVAEERRAQAVDCEYVALQIMTAGSPVESMFEEVCRVRWRPIVVESHGVFAQPIDQVCFLPRPRRRDAPGIAAIRNGLIAKT